MFKEYPSIITVFKRNPETNFKTLLEGQYALPEFEYLQNNFWIFTEKVDGTNIRVMFDGEKITFGGKTDNAQIPGFLINRLNDIFLPQLEFFKNKFDNSCCLYGEGYGNKIQKSGKNYIERQDYILFDVKVGEWWLQREDVKNIAETFQIDIVPVIGQGTLFDMVEMVRSGFDSCWGKFKAEGIVARPQIELFNRNNQRIITKIKHRDFR